jgi:hypothetical protein
MAEQPLFRQSGLVPSGRKRSAPAKLAPAARGDGPTFGECLADDGRLFGEPVGWNPAGWLGFNYDLVESNELDRNVDDLPHIRWVVLHRPGNGFGQSIVFALRSVFAAVVVSNRKNACCSHFRILLVVGCRSQRREKKTTPG